MSIIHDIIKIKFVREGYLPNYPYHLISDDEMCDAFLSKDDNDNWQGYFVDNYYLPNGVMESTLLWKIYYGDTSEPIVPGLLPTIANYLEEFKAQESDIVRLPNWIYSYMIGSTIGPNSDYADLQDLLKLLNISMINIAFTSEVAQQCYNVSKEWLSKYSSNADQRPPTIFGEPHVIKNLRLNQIDLQY